MLSKTKSVLADIQDHGVFLPPQYFKSSSALQMYFPPFSFCMPKTKKESVSAWLNEEIKKTEGEEWKEEVDTNLSQKYPLSTYMLYIYTLKQQTI